MMCRRKIRSLSSGSARSRTLLRGLLIGDARNSLSYCRRQRSFFFMLTVRQQQDWR
jgi:hypothetical protein